MRDFDTAILENLYESVLSESVLDMALFKNLGFSEKNKSKKEILEYVKKYGPDIINFLMALNIYQSSYRTVSFLTFYRLYMKLPTEFKEKYYPDPIEIQNSYRGDDDMIRKNVLSFTTHSNPEIAFRNAGFFGSSIFTISDLKSYDGILSTPKLVTDNSLEDIIDFLGIGDDENEILVFNGVWKPEMSEKDNKEEVNNLFYIVVKHIRNPEITSYIYDIMKKKNTVMPESLIDNIIKKPSEAIYFILELLKRGVEVPEQIFERFSKSLQSTDYFTRALINNNIQIPPTIIRAISENPTIALNIILILIEKRKPIPEEFYEEVSRLHIKELKFLYAMMNDYNVPIPEIILKALEKSKVSDPPDLVNLG